MTHPSFTRRRLLLALGAALACAPVARAARSDPQLRIGVSLGLTGLYANESEMQAKGYRLWAQHLAERGGIGGRPVELLIRDDRSDPAMAVHHYEDFILREHLDFVFGPFSSALTLAVAPVAERHGYPMLAAGAAADDIWQQGYRYVFGTIPPAGRQAIGFLAVLADAGIDTLAVVQSDDAYSANLAAGAIKWSPEYGVRITTVERVAKGGRDHVAPARAARRSGALALLMAGHFDEAVSMRRALRRIDWTPAAFFASVGPTRDRYAEMLDGEVDGIFAPSTWEALEALPFPGSADFLGDFRARYGDTPSFLAAQAYAGGQLLERAIKRAGGPGRAGVRDALAAMDTEVITGRYAVDRSGMLSRRFPLLVQWQRGRREVVWPPGLRTASPHLPPQLSL